MSNRTLNLNDTLYDYLLAHSPDETDAQMNLREHTAGLEWSQMQIAPEQGFFMAFLVRLLGVRNALEIGVYTGYSSLSVAQALPGDGRLVACDVSKEWTDIARQYWQQAGVDQKIDLHLRPATETLQSLLDDGQRNRFDFAFIDADKENYDGYYEYCLKLIRPGGLILVDNTLWGGDVANIHIKDKDTRAIRALNDKIKRDRRIEQCLLPIADGIAMIRKL